MAQSDHELQPITRRDGSQGLPAHGYSWEPFVPEHVRSMVHGGNSPRIIEAVARIVRSEVTEQAPWLLEPIFGDALERYCRAEARSRLLTDHILRVADEKGAHKIPVRLWDSASASDNAAMKAAGDLGLTPLSRAKLASLTTSTELTAVGIEALAEKGAAIRAARQTALAEADDGE